MFEKFFEYFLGKIEKGRYICGKKTSIMNSSSLSVTDLYGQWLSSLSVSEKLDIISLLTDSLRPKKSKTEKVGIDAIFAGFSKDWGGEGAPEEIAASLRENSLETRDVEVW